tara:strand:+ start:25 stop:210 length:186 start_codon:yes stop_codon:yes gene_type:complete
MKHFTNNGKEYLKKPVMTEEDIKYRQGRSRHRVEATEKFAAWTMMISIILIGILILLSQLV